MTEQSTCLTLEDHLVGARAMARTFQQAPCRYKRKTCIERQRDQPLTPAERRRFARFRRRPFFAYDVAKMCPVCAGYYYATNAINVIDAMIKAKAARAERAARKSAAPAA